MAITTYAELQAAVASWLLRTDLTATIPDFISLAEANIARDLRHWRQEKRVTSTANERYENVPVDWLETISLRNDDGTEIKHAGIDFMSSRNQTQTGKPKLYRLDAGTFEFWPHPPESQAITLTYFARIPALTDSETSNWLLAQYPDIYLYGTLAQSAPFLKDDERIPIWAGLYQRGIDMANAESKAARHSGQLSMKVRAYG